MFDGFLFSLSVERAQSVTEFMNLQVGLYESTRVKTTRLFIQLILGWCFVDQTIFQIFMSFFLGLKLVL